MCCRLISLFSLTTRRPPRSSPLSLHDALPISGLVYDTRFRRDPLASMVLDASMAALFLRFSQIQQPHVCIQDRSEEHTSELQSHHDLVCRLLLEKKKT